MPAAPRAIDDPGATPTTDDWRAKVRELAESHLPHTAWGPAYARRDYEMTRALGHAEAITVDDDALSAETDSLRVI